MWFKKQKEQDKIIMPDLDVLNEVSLKYKMMEITREGKIPALLQVEMCLYPTASALTKPIPYGKTQYSSVYPGLEVKIWNKTGWELT